MGEINLKVVEVSCIDTSRRFDCKNKTVEWLAKGQRSDYISSDYRDPAVRLEKVRTILVVQFISPLKLQTKTSA